MPFPSSPEDRPDPNDNMPAMRARIPDHIARGEISTGVIVVTGATEYVLDFVRNLPRPNAIVARVILPHLVMPQFIEALAANMELFRQRYGELPGSPQPPVVSQSFQAGPATPSAHPDLGFLAETKQVDVWPGAQPTSGPIANPGPDSMAESTAPQPVSNIVPPGTPPTNAAATNQNSGPTANANANQGPLKRQNPQEVYDDLKLRDEILSGAYANAVMIGHGPYEFSFDFITNFYPQSAVSCRVFLASGHIYRLLESLRASWEQLRPRLSQNQPPNQPPPPPPRNLG